MSVSAAVRRGVLGAVVVLLAIVPGAGAFEALDGDLQVHGFGEMQLRTIANDFSTGNDFDLTQWYNVLNVEVEWDIALDGWGPFSYLSAYARLEGRYDCVWQGACTLFNSVNAFGDDASHVPKRLVGGRRDGFDGVLDSGDRRPWHSVPQDKLDFQFRGQGVTGSREPAPLFNMPSFATLYNNAGIDGIDATEDDPASFAFRRFDDYRFLARRTRGNQGGVGTQIMGPWQLRDVDPIGSLRNVPNPFKPEDMHPEFAAPVPLLIGGVGDPVQPGILDVIPAGTALRGFGGLPFRPVPDAEFTSMTGDLTARGLYIPNRQLRELLEDGDFDNHDQNFRQEELEWNHGASQQDEKELKELYLDMEFFDGRLWVRAGKQNIVWGKTELFRTTDQFNPQDLALASLPSLEESRIPLWAIRAVYSFYNVGPLQDVRLELAANIDQFEPADLGDCGEPYTPNPVCSKSFGLLAHGITGAALAGEVRPPNPWNSWKGLEVGARLEFRWNRFSVQISDFYGYNDTPYVDRFYEYSRNVDPRTGRPREGMSRGRCIKGTEEACLEAHESLTDHHANQQLYAVICATSLAFAPDIDPTACGLSVLGSPGIVEVAGAPGVSVATAVSTILAGGARPGSSFNGGTALAGLLGDIAFQPLGNALLVELNEDPMDCVMPTCDPRVGLPPGLRFAPGAGPQVPANLQNGQLGQFFITAAASRFLTDEQEALLGCGPFYGTSCDLPGGGVDLMNAEGSALMQSWAGFEGTAVETGTWDTTDTSVWQPGTIGFDGGPVCTRYENGKTYVLPGCRGPGDDGYDPNVDGSPDGLIHPFTDPAVRAFLGLPAAGGDKLNQQFANEMAAVSYNAMIGLIALSGLSEEDKGVISAFDPDDPFRKGKCSFREPIWCGNIRSFIGVIGVQRNTVRAGGNGRFGRRDFVWQGGSAAALRYEKRNVFGISADFAEDVTKSNWSLEFTYIEEQQATDHDEFDGLAEVDEFNLTVSVDRPTFINFLNQNRTFFFNAQFFFQWLKNYETSFPGNGPFNVLGTFTVQTGYFQDRLLPAMTIVYDFNAPSGAVLPSFTYRFTENFSATFGLAFFFGHVERRDVPIVPLGPIGNTAGQDAYRTFVENGLTVVRDRDEAFLRLRYTF